MSYAAWSLVYGEQPSTAKWNILGTNDSHFHDFLGDNLEWQSWTPALSNLTLGNGTINAKYAQVGKTVFCRFSFRLGTTSAVGSSPNFSRPVTSATTLTGIIGACLLVDLGASSYYGSFYYINTTAVGIACTTGGGTYGGLTGITAAVPFTWGSTDYIAGHFSYEAA